MSNNVSKSNIIDYPLPETPLKNSNTKNPTKLWCGGRIRFNIIFNLLVIIIAGIPFFIPTYITFAMNAFYACSWVIFVILAIYTHNKIRKFLK